MNIPYKYSFNSDVRDVDMQGLISEHMPFDIMTNKVRKETEFAIFLEASLG